MDVFSYVQEIGKQFYIYGWRDLVEILFFTLLLYSISQWLKKDTQKNLLWYFYCYVSLLIACHSAELYTLSSLLFYSSPLVGMLFILFHQRTLQTNFITLKNIRPAHTITTSWPSELVKAVLIALNKNKNNVCVVERGDSLNDLVFASPLVQAPVNHELIALLIESAVYNNKSMWWVNRQGILVSFNAFWREHTQDQWLSEDVKQAHQWKQEAVIFTTKTDCLVFKAEIATRLFEVVIDGKIIAGVTADELLALLYKTCFLTSSLEKEKLYVNSFKNSNQQQPVS